MQTVDLAEVVHKFADLLKDPIVRDRIRERDPSCGGLKRVLSVIAGYAKNTCGVQLLPGELKGVSPRINGG